MAAKFRIPGQQSCSDHGAHCASCLRPGSAGFVPEGGKPTSGNGWKEYTAPDGRKYYHKAATNTTQWTRPAEMDEAAAGGGGGAGVTGGTSASADDAPASQTSTSAASSAEEGNKESKPNGDAAKEKGSEEEAGKKEAKEPPKKKPKPEPIPDLPAKKYESKEEAMADFKEMLEEKVPALLAVLVQQYKY